MLDAFYSAIFNRPTAPLQGFWVSLGVLTVLAFNVATQLNVGGIGLLMALFTTFVVGTTACFAYLLLVHFFIHLMNGFASPSYSLSPLRGLWPLVLSGPLLSLQQLTPKLGSLMVVGLLIGTVTILIKSVEQDAELSVSQAAICVMTSLILLTLSSFALVGWPLMLILGLKSMG